ncbi:MAG: hypothetical protein J2P52_06275 [Blastocatellia bacterium]|nr:hypothetical protein [Blastocatellia bacterium]
MRTIFEDTISKAEMEDSRSRGNERKSTLPILWLVALLFLGSVWGVYRWADSHSAVQPPAPPASVEDPKQRSEILGKFNHAVLDGNWSEAETLLSTGAKQRLAAEQKSLAESLLGKFKDSKVVGAEMTQSIDTSEPEKARVDCLYKFTDADYTKVEDRILSLILVIDKGDGKGDPKLAIDNWSGVTEERKEGSKPAENK